MNKKSYQTKTPSAIQKNTAQKLSFNMTFKKLVVTWYNRHDTRARNENNRLTDVGSRRKTPQKSRSVSFAECVNIMLRLDKGFCYRKPVAVNVLDTSRAVSGGAWSEARAPAPPPSDKPGATPPGDAYAPLGAAGTSHTPPAAPRLPARQTSAQYAPHLRNFTTASHRDALQQNRQLSTP